jgi:hypothetical protein
MLRPHPVFATGRIDRMFSRLLCDPIALACYLLDRGGGWASSVRTRLIRLGRRRRRGREANRLARYGEFDQVHHRKLAIRREVRLPARLYIEAGKRIALK